MRATAWTGLLCLVALTRAAGLQTRDNSCGDTSSTFCAGSNFPSNFCCPSNTKCIPLNGATSLICCPAGQSCQYIAPIACDILQQNATAHPDNPIKNTNLTATLPSCGGSCCPQGYNCQDGQCAMQKTPSSPSSNSAAPTSAPTIATPTSSRGTPTPTPTTMSNLSSNSSAGTSTSQASAYPAQAILVGFFPGLLLGAILGAAGVLLYRGRKKIGPPMYQPQDVTRSDFLRKGSMKPRSLFRRSMATIQRSSQSQASTSEATAVSRAEARKSEGVKSLANSETTSMEFVLHEAPIPMTMRSSQITAFTDLMEGAGFRRGEPYLLATEGRSREV